MRIRYVFLLVAAGAVRLSHGQSLPAVYLDSQGRPTVPDSATHYRVVERRNELLGTHVMREFSLLGELLLKGTLSSIDPPVRNGLLTWYHPGGSRAAQVQYRDDEANGLYVGWYEDGRVSQRGDYVQGQRVGRWLSVHRNGQKRSEGHYNTGRPVGEWRYYYDTGELSAIEMPDRQGRPLALAFFNKDGSPYMQPVQVRKLPRFLGGEAALLSFVAQNTTYPREVRRKGIVGNVLVSYTVGEDGHVGQVRITQGLAAEADREALRVVAALPRFEPGREYNLPTAMTFTIPIYFGPGFSLASGLKPPQTPPSEARAAAPEATD
ncbi:TonB family protein [Hymenobacter sp. ISL-91]|uniref:energy transducer TonB n=1 Tax=Hymenobacter sp. ISL-91 TaxID=2819151 RepID=UPI001BEA1D05|nr:energy transducer TonB [Hymenobacter sp. ISL-91]MBT2558044.1 TonB family protein [Hymenobacter sp. ISL-91]